MSIATYFTRITQGLSCMLMSGIASTVSTAATDPPSYAEMAPLQQYLISDRNSEIALARSAAPASVSGQATVLVLGRNGYASAIPGNNGFTCLVERSWMNTFDNPEFWNPRMRAPICYNAAASRSVLPYTLFRTSRVLMGATKAQLLEQIRTAVAQKKLSTPEIGSMSYMMSKGGYIADGAGPWHSHLMFHIPRTDTATWGANLAGSPVIVDTDHTEVPEPQTIFMVPVGHWSDGTEAPMHNH